MITNFRFAQLSDNEKNRKKWFYVYHNNSGNVLINSLRCSSDWAGINFGYEIEAILSHETLHKVLFKLEGSRASSGLDKWCKTRKWIWNDECGICFLASEMGEFK